jgi:hypothetical protein
MMFEPRTFHGVALPEQINWVHTTFGAWHPVVRGSCIPRALLGLSIGDVHFSVGNEDLDDIKRCVSSTLRANVNPVAAGFAVILRSEVAAEFTFACNGRTYHVWKASEAKEELTIDSLTSSGVNQVSGSRIGFQDLAQRQARPMRSDVGRRFFENEKLADVGFSWVKPEHLPEGRCHYF